MFLLKVKVKMSTSILYFIRFSVESFIFELKHKMLSVNDGPTDLTINIIKIKIKFIRHFESAVATSLCISHGTYIRW